MVKKYDLCTELVVNHELIGAEHIQIRTIESDASKEQKKKAFFKGAGLGGGLGILLTLLIFL